MANFDRLIEYPKIRFHIFAQNETVVIIINFCFKLKLKICLSHHFFLMKNLSPTSFRSNQNQRSKIFLKKGRRFKVCLHEKDKEFQQWYFNNILAKKKSQIIISIPVTQKHQYKTRQAKQNYFQPRKRTELGKKTFSYVGPKIWQEVPFELKSLSCNKFKKKFKLFLTSQY